MEADAAILPGVGSFGHAMECLQNANLVQPVLDFIHSGKPFLGICLGLQLLFEESEESPGVKGDVYKRQPETLHYKELLVFFNMVFTYFCFRDIIERMFDF